MRAARAVFLHFVAGVAVCAASEAGRTLLREYEVPPPSEAAAPAKASALTSGPSLDCWLSFAWALTALLIGTYALHAAARYHRGGATFDYGALVACGVSSLFEGSGFLFLSADLLVGSPVARFLGHLLQFSEGGANWVLTIFLMNLGGKTPAGKVWAICAVLAGLAGLAYAAAALLGRSDVETALFVAWFEPPLFFGFASALCNAATSRRGERHRAALLFLLFDGMLYGAHLYTVFYTLANRAGITTTLLTHQNIGGPTAFPKTRVLSILSAPAMVAALQRMVELGMFNAQPEPCGSKGALRRWAAREQEASARGATICLLNPEHVWSYASLFVLAGYSGSAFLLFTVTRPDFQQDAIFRLYHTFHPCVLLDYLPGTLIAQPMFTASTILQILALALSAVRAALTGHVLLMLASAFAFVWFTIVGCLFELVFTFNPKAVSVLAHSIPDMLIGTSAQAYMLASIFAIWAWPGGLRNGSRRVHATLQASFYVGAVVYGLTFMLRKLLLDAGYGGSGVAGSHHSAMHGGAAKEMPDLWAPNATVAGTALEDEPITFEPLPMLAAISVQVALYTFGLSSPLRAMPLACEVSAAKGEEVERRLAGGQGRADAEEGAVLVASAAAPSALAGRNLAWLHVRVRTPLVAAMGLTLLFQGATRWLDGAVYGEEEVATWGWREGFTRRPGVAVTAVGWVIVTLCLGLHALLQAVHEWLTNPLPAMRFAVYVAAVLLPSTALLAHAGTIPDAPSWFHGAEAFLVAFSMWLFLQAALKVQLLLRLCTAVAVAPDAHMVVPRSGNWCGNVAALLGADAAIAVVAGVAMLRSCVAPGQTGDLAWMGLALLFALFDATGAEVRLDHVRVADDADLAIKPHSYAGTWDADEHNEDQEEDVSAAAVGKGVEDVEGARPGLGRLAAAATAAGRAAAASAVA